jgi:argonaute-like protein implicated in RNA metabolism and viral defense
MLSKLGNIPYVLASPLPYADIVVGIDVARRRKTKLAGSINATAIARIYQNSGEFLQYAIHDTVIEGETIPSDVLHTLFPAAIFRGKRVVIHRDGIFRGEEKLALQAWATQLGAQFYLVEILKTGTPRLYQFQSSVSQQFQTMQQPVKGSVLKLNNTEAFLISSLPPYASVTPYPLHIRCEAPFPIEQAVHSILSLTLLHYGSLRTPRLPVTIHYSDEIAYLALKGIKPKSLEGTLPFWL